MANLHATGTHSTVIRCPNCGEDYSITYKRCPFCDEKTVQPSRRRAAAEEDYDEPDQDLFDEEDEDYVPPKGGKRLANASPRRGGGNRGGGGWTPFRVVGTVISLAIIVAAIWIVATQVVPLVHRGGTVETPPADPTAVVTPSPDPGGDNVVVPPETGAPGETDPVTTPDPNTMIPSTQTATGFSLGKSDFTLKPGETYQFKVSFTPAGSTGFITWSIDKPNVATVDENGKVTPVGTGSATVTATMAGGVSHTCIVRCSGGSSSEGGSSSGSENITTPAPSATLSLNRADFSFSKAGETFKMKVNGATGDPVWSIGNTAVATISGDGTVTAVGSGTTNISCTVDGQTLKCIVRCQF